MSDHYDDAETQVANAREAALFGGLAVHLTSAVAASPGLAVHLEGCDLDIHDRAALAKLPVLRKADLMAAQAANPPFGGFVDMSKLAGTRLFSSPGPIWEPQGLGADPWGGARALHAAGFRRGDIVHNALSYHMTPGGFILDEGLRAIGCTVFPAGVGNTDLQVEAAAALRPVAYTGTPDYLKVILDRAVEQGVDLSCIRRALVSGGALFPSLRDEYAERGVQVMQCYATADLGTIAYQTASNGEIHPGMVVNEGMIVEIVRPGTGDPVTAGEVGELVVTNLSDLYPLVRFATGDLTKEVPEPSPCGRTNMRIAGWMGRADQRTKIKGMFVDPKQIAEIRARHSEITGARLVVERRGASDSMTLRVTGEGVDVNAVADTLRGITRLGGRVEAVETLPNDGKVIADERDYDA
ncbi:AMP-binding protein [Rhizobiaceae bacterium]|nr:AMP-binding protein [Rhizobiaceae bacterium]